MKLFISVPSNRGWSPLFGNSMVGLAKRLAQQGIEFEFDCLMGSSCLPRARAEALRTARERGATHLLFIDDDMAFPETLAEDLLGHGKAFVAANCVTKQAWNPQPTAIGFDGQRVTSKDKTGLEKVKRVGLGIALIDLTQMVLSEPLFAVPWDEDAKEYISEDFFFVMRLEQVGIDRWIDHDISNKIAHCGEYAYHF